MHNLKTSPISNTSRFPIKQGTLDFLQFNQSDIAAGCINLPFDCFNYREMVYIYTSFTDPFSAGLQGYVFCVNEVGQWEYLQILYTGDTINPYTSPTIVNAQFMGLFQRQYQGTNGNADPVTFTDGTVNNVHNFRFVRFSTTVPVANPGETLLLQFQSVSTSPIFQIMNSFYYQANFDEIQYSGTAITTSILSSVNSIAFMINETNNGATSYRVGIKFSNGDLTIKLASSYSFINNNNGTTNVLTKFYSINNLFTKNFTATSGIDVGSYIFKYFPLIRKRFINNYYQTRIFDSVNFGVYSIPLFYNSGGTTYTTLTKGIYLANVSTYGIGVYINTSIFDTSTANSDSAPLYIEYSL